MSSNGKRRGHKHRRRKNQGRERQGASLSMSLPRPGRLKVLAILLVLSALLSVGLSRCNRTAVVTDESPESIQMKQQMINQFIQKEEGVQEGGDGASSSGGAP